MKTSDETSEIFKGFALFRKQLKQPLKDAANPFFKSKYVPLENVVDVVDKALEGTGLSYTQEIETNQNGANLVHTIIMHESGQYMIVAGAELKPIKQDPQGVGSAITYNRRYSLSTAFGIASDPDDDGNEASAAPQTTKSRGSNPTKQAKPLPKKDPKILLEEGIATAQVNFAATNDMAEQWRAMNVNDAMAAVRNYVDKVKEGQNR